MGNSLRSEAVATKLLFRAQIVENIFHP